MSTKKSNTKQYQVNAKITVEVGLKVEAESIEAALEIGRKFELADYVTVEGDWLDSNDPEIISVWLD